MGALLRGALWVGGILAGASALNATGDVIEETGEAAEKSANLVKWVVIGGVLYYGAKQVGAIK